MSNRAQTEKSLTINILWRLKFDFHLNESFTQIHSNYLIFETYAFYFLFKLMFFKPVCVVLTALVTYSLKINYRRSMLQKSQQEKKDLNAETKIGLSSPIRTNSLTCLPQHDIVQSVTEILTGHLEDDSTPSLPLNRKWFSICIFNILREVVALLDKILSSDYNLHNAHFNN